MSYRDTPARRGARDSRSGDPNHRRIRPISTDRLARRAAFIAKTPAEAPLALAALAILAGEGNRDPRERTVRAAMARLGAQLREALDPGDDEARAEADRLWHAALEELSRSRPDLDRQLAIWTAGCEGLRIRGPRLAIGAPPLPQSWLDMRYRRLLEPALAKISNGAISEICFVDRWGQA